MAKETARLAKKTAQTVKAPTSAAEAPEAVLDDIGRGLLALATATQSVGEDIAEKLHDLYHMDDIATNLGDIGSALHSVAHARAMAVIAQYGSDEDRAIAVAYLKRWFYEDFPRD